MSDLCRFLSEATAAGVPSARALRDAGTIRFNSVIRGRVCRWAQLCTEGASLADAANDARMPRLTIGFLATAEKAANVPEALAFLARHYGSNFSRSYVVLVNAIKPGAIIAVALFEGWIVVSLFMPLVKLMNEVSLSTGYM